MKKSGVWIMAAAVGAMLLAGACAGDSRSTQNMLDPDKPVSIEIWHYYNGPQKLAFDSLVTQFNETVGQEKGIVVEAFSQGNINELSQKIHDAVDKKVGASGVPTAFSTYIDTVYDLDKQNVIASLDSYFTKEELEEYVDAYIGEGRFDEEGSLKIIPTGKSTETLMVNKTDWDLFAADTGASLSDLGTIEGLVDTSEDYYNWTDAKTPDIQGDGKAMFGRDAMANYIILGYYQLTGKSLFSHKGGKVTFEPEEAAFRKLWDSYYIPYINGWFGSYGRFRSDDAKTGDIIALVGSTTGAYYFPDQVTRADDTSYPIEAAVFAAPCFAGAKPSAIQQGAGMAVIASDPKTELAAATFLKWFVEADRNINFSISSAYLPVKEEANDMDLIRESGGFQELPTAVQDALSVSVDVVNKYELYFEPAFSGSSDARRVMEYSLSDRAKADREQVLALAEGGMPLAEAVASYATDQSFQSWYQEFVDGVRAAIDMN
ncbi:MAG TPA: extracellular solute-binding protein [Clostridiales bacterium]|nr:extracellular solute-binding protein [Clostridiales bacterium]